MTIGEWFESHKDVEFTIKHPKTKAGHKTDIEMCSKENRMATFRESITYKEPSEEHIVELLESMYESLMEQHVSM